MVLGWAVEVQQTGVGCVKRFRAGRVQAENGQRTGGFSRLRFGPVRELGVSI